MGSAQIEELTTFVDPERAIEAKLFGISGISGDLPAHLGVLPDVSVYQMSQVD
jgi:hypothetical protein